MSDSAAPDASAVEEQISELEVVVGRLVEELQSWRSRAQTAETAHRQLQRALRATPSAPENGGDLEVRLRSLGEENERLQGLLREGRSRAERIRSRLIVMEDEANS
ncbi:MAG: hypothetical protein V3U67_05185 [Gemmatimonadota bacterium]